MKLKIFLKEEIKLKISFKKLKEKIKELLLEKEKTDDIKKKNE